MVVLQQCIDTLRSLYAQRQPNSVTCRFNRWQPLPDSVGRLGNAVHKRLLLLLLLL
jgi:hypothetical protein